MKNTSIHFVRNGTIKMIDPSSDNINPTTTVLRYLREHAGCMGTKEGCAEGDCGACTVVLGEPAGSGKMRYTAVDSCLLFVPALHGKQLITVEDLELNNQPHPVQQAMIDCNGSQCGYCTPGFVMSLLALQKKGGDTDRIEIEDALTGNLCRCTGYRPIVDAAQRILKEQQADHFDHTASATATLLESIPVGEGLEINTGQHRYFRPVSIEEALRLKHEFPELIPFNGATDLALRVTKRHETLTDLLDLSGIASLKTIRMADDFITIGAGCTLETIRTSLQKQLPALTGMLDVFGSRQIRSLATLGGNLGSASPIGDTLPVLMAYAAAIELSDLHGKRIVPMHDFITGYRTTVRKPEELITAILLPVPEKNVLIRSYKVSKRKDLDISTLSGGFRLKLENGMIREAMLAFGGMAAKTERATAAEQFLLDKAWSDETADEAAQLASKQFSPISDARAGAAFRTIVSGNLIRKFRNDTSDR